jgi:hypothetical protein
MPDRKSGGRKAAALRKVRRITGAATGGAALTAAVFGATMAHEIPGTPASAVVSKTVASRTSTSSTSSTSSGGSARSSYSTPTTTTTTTTPTTTGSSPTVVSGATSS